VPRAQDERWIDRAHRRAQAFGARALVVSAYRAIGLAVLAFILMGLVSYVGTLIFYTWNKRWVQPVVVSTTDDRVLQLNTQRAEHASARDRLSAELSDLDRVIKSGEEFQSGFRAALAAELAEQRAVLSRLRRVAGHMAQVEGELASTNDSYRHYSRKRLHELERARLVDRETLLGDQYRLGQAAQARLSLATSSAELNTRTTALARQTEGLAATLAPDNGKPASYEVLKMKQDLERSELETARAREQRAAVVQSLERHKQILHDISESPYLRAVERRGALAFAPYDNTDGLTAGDAIYACRLGALVCRRVGMVVTLMPGEATLKHPVFSSVSRGQNLEISLTEPDAARSRVLFTKRPPFYL
jgi:hypothetical protein